MPIRAHRYAANLCRMTGEAAQFPLRLQIPRLVTRERSLHADRPRDEGSHERRPVDGAWARQATATGVWE